MTKTFTIQVFNKGGGYFRKYTKDTLQMLYDTSPSAANFEMIIVIEGLVFMALRTYYLITNDNDSYNKFIKDKKTFYNAIEKLYYFGIIEDPLRVKLNEYRNLRNEIAHDLFQLKSVFTNNIEFKDYPHSESLKKLFESGLIIFTELGEIVTPWLPTKEEYFKRFSGFYKKQI